MLTFRITFFLILTQATQEPLSETAETADEEEDASTFKPPGIPSHGAAAEMLEKCVLWYEHQKEAEPTTLSPSTKNTYIGI